MLTGPDQLVPMDPSPHQGEASPPALRDLLRPVWTAALRRDPREEGDLVDLLVDDQEAGQEVDLEADPVVDLALRRKPRLLTMNDLYLPK